jgi:anthranilate phosphoribosyltransferase
MINNAGQISNLLMKEAIAQVVSGQDLSEEQAMQVMNTIMEGQASPAQIAAFLTALRLKEETVEEITGFARVMRQKATTISSIHSLVVDTCGTGGDGANTFNISTAAAFILAGAGITVAKHGNRFASSRCGSADVLEALGIKIDLTAAQVARCLNEVGVGFLFAPLFHEAMKYAAGPRREIGIRTVFNILGPLTNPANATAQIVGVYSSNLVPKIARVLVRLGTKNAFVFYGADGLDEISLTGPSYVAEVNKKEVKEYYLHPEEYGFSPVSLKDLAGGSPAENADVILEILKGKKGAQRDIVILNAALGIIAAEKAGTIEEGVIAAQESIDSGAALKKLEQLRQYSTSV